MKVRNAKMLALIVAGSLGLSACSIPVALSDTNATLGASAFLQMHLSANLFAKGPSLATTIKLLKQLRFDVNYESTTSAPLSSSLNTAKSEVIVFNGTQRVATVVDVHSNLYLNVNIPSLAHVSGLGLTSAKLAPINLLFGSRWFEFPHSLVAQYETSLLHVKSTTTPPAATEMMLVNALVSFFAHQPTTTTATGFTQVGTFASLQRAVAALVKSATTTTVFTKKAPGSYKLAVTMNGNVASAAKLAITAPDGKYGDGTLTLNATFAQASVHVDSPSNALVITKSFLNQLGQLGGATLGTTKVGGSSGAGILSGVLG